MSTPNTGIPYVPENTQDPAAGLNLALNVIDALLQTAVIDMGQTAPPGSPNDGDLHIVGADATGAWAGQDNNLARYVAEGDFWQFYEAGTQVRIVLNLGDGGLYAWTGSTWAPASAAAPVQSVNGKTGAVVLTAEDVGADPTGTAVETLAQAIGDGPAQLSPNSEFGTAAFLDWQQFEAYLKAKYGLTEV